MRSFIICCLGLVLTASLSLARELKDAHELMSQMQEFLDLQEDQVSNITPIIERYTALFQALQKSIDDNTINPSSMDNQRQNLEDQETQEISQYLKPDQLSRWRQMQSQMDEQEEPQDNSDSNSTTNSVDDDRYSNLPQGSNNSN